MKISPEPFRGWFRLTLHYNGATDSAAREIKLIFNSWNLQRIDNTDESALEKPPVSKVAMASTAAMTIATEW